MLYIGEGNETLRQFGKAREDVKFSHPKLMALMYTLGLKYLDAYLMSLSIGSYLRRLYPPARSWIICFADDRHCLRHDPTTMTSWHFLQSHVGPAFVRASDFKTLGTPLLRVLWNGQGNYLLAMPLRCIECCRLFYKFS